MNLLVRHLGYEYHIPGNGHRDQRGKMIDMEWLVYLCLGIKDDFKTVWSCRLRMPC